MKFIEKNYLTGRPAYVEGFFYSMLNKSIVTRRNYVSYIVRFLDSFGWPDLKAITMDDVNKYLSKLSMNKDGSKKSGTTLMVHYSGLNLFFEYAKATHLIDSNPLEDVARPKPKRYDKVKRTYLKPDEINKCFEVINREREDYRLRDKAIFVILFAAGIRATCLTEINVGDVNFETSSIHVTDKRDKDRDCFFSSDKMAVIREWFDYRNKVWEGKPHSEALFLSRTGNRLNDNDLNYITKKITSQIGHPVSPHKGRYSFGTNAINAGVAIDQVSKMLGHDNIETTIHCYIQDQDEKIKDTTMRATSYMVV